MHVSCLPLLPLATCVLTLQACLHITAMWKSVSYMEDGMARQSGCSMPLLTRSLYWKTPFWLSALHELKRIRADNRRRRRRKTSNRQGFAIILIQIYVYSNFGSSTYLFFSLCHSLIHLSVSLNLCLFISRLLFRSFITVWTRGSISTGLAATGGAEKETQHWGGLADAPCYFPSTSHWLCQQGLSLSRASELRTCPLQLSQRTYHRHALGREAGGSGFHHCLFPPV